MKTSDLAIDVLLMAMWRRKSKQEVMIHSDQGGGNPVAIQFAVNAKAAIAPPPRRQN